MSQMLSDHIVDGSSCVSPPAALRFEVTSGTSWCLVSAVMLTLCGSACPGGGGEGGGEEQLEVCDESRG